jgi:hypothetical protein
MPLITKGNVPGLELQPGWSIDNDGYGLLTSRLTFRCKKEGVGDRPKKLDAHPEDSRLQCHRSSYTQDGAWATVVAEYVGLEAGTYTPIQWAADFSGSTQPIQSHPNFVNVKFGTATPLKDLGWDKDAQAFPEDNSVAETNGLVGIRQFIAAEMAVTGTFYTSDKSWLQKWADGVGKTFEALPGDSSVVLISTFQPISPNHDRKSLLTGIAYEMYAHLYKVNFQAKVATGGFHKFVYDRAPTT